MNSHIKSAIACALAAFVLSSPLAARAVPGFAPAKFAALAVDNSTGKVLFARNADARRYPASLTKVMTLYLAFDALRAGRLHLNDPIVVSRHAAAQPPSKVGLRPGSRLTVREALNLIVVKSANDVTVALAEKIGGSEPRFVHRMNAKAAALGMRHTHFANASGLPDRRNYSTARDLAVLARAVIRRYPRRYALFDQTSTRFHGRLVPGHNHLLRLAGVDGMKTGYIDAAGFNLITSAVHGDRRIVAVVLGGDTARTRDRYMAGLIRTSFAAARRRPATVLAAAKRHRSGRRSEPPVQLASTAGAPWRVQVGAFSSAAAGSARLAAVSREHPRRFDPDDGLLRKVNGLYVARFAANSRKEAVAACAVLERAGEDCLALEHSTD